MDQRLKGGYWSMKKCQLLIKHLLNKDNQVVYGFCCKRFKVNLSLTVMNISNSTFLLERKLTAKNCISVVKFNF